METLLCEAKQMVQGPGDPLTFTPPLSFSLTLHNASKMHQCALSGHLPYLFQKAKVCSDVADLSKILTVPPPPAISPFKITPVFLFYSQGIFLILLLSLRQWHGRRAGRGEGHLNIHTAAKWITVYVHASVSCISKCNAFLSLLLWQPTEVT